MKNNNTKTSPTQFLDV